MEAGSDASVVAYQDPYILIEAQDWFAEDDPSRDNGILVKEGKPATFTDLGEAIEIGRDLCIRQELYSPPEFDLCAVMGEDQICSGQIGINRVVWCTTLPADGVVYASVASSSGPWNVYASHSDYRQCHEVTFESPAIDATIWFYVVSETEDGRQLTSSVRCYLTGSEITLSDSNFVGNPTLSKHLVKSAHLDVPLGVTVVEQPNGYTQSIGVGSVAVSTKTVVGTVNVNVSTWEIIIVPSVV